MNHAQYVRAMRLALDGDEQAWQPALSEALRRQDRERQFQLLQLEVERSGHPEWETPNNLNPIVWHGVELCWDARTARLFAADCAERVLHLFEDAHPEDRRPREAIRVARAYAMGQATLDELRAAGSAARDAAWEAAGNAAWEAAEEAARGAAGAAAGEAVSAAWGAAGAGARAAAWAGAGAGGADERDWQRERLAQYLLGQVIPCWDD